MATMSDTAAHPLQNATTDAVIPKTPNMNSNDSTPKASSDYEKCREQRIKENLERMQKLGIHDLSLKLKSIKPSSQRKNHKPYKTPNRCVSPLPSSVPSRRSSRLQNTPPVTYAEVDLSKNSKEEKDTWMVGQPRPEVYTEEQEKLLGEAKTEWTLFVDGYGKDGKRIYDQVRGKTCHQCRQKTLGHRTHCIKCNLVTGQFCGDCLYMRYGENVLEAMQNPDWICPSCRGICNCSFCRQAKGWAPTGVLYRKISSLGYKSVAHYLIQTHRADPDTTEKSEGTTNTNTKRSLPFSKEDTEAQNVVEIQSSDGSKGNNVKPESTQKTELESGSGNQPTELIKDNKPEELESLNEGSNPDLECKIPKVDEGEEKNMSIVIGHEDNKSEGEVKIVITPETKVGSRKKRCAVMVENSIAGRLRSRRKCV